MNREVDWHLIAPGEIAVDLTFGTQTSLINDADIGHTVSVVVGELNVSAAAQPFLNVGAADVGHVVSIPSVRRAARATARAATAN